MVVKRLGATIVTHDPEIRLFWGHLSPNKHHYSDFQAQFLLIHSNIFQYYIVGQDLRSGSGVNHKKWYSQGKWLTNIGCTSQQYVCETDFIGALRFNLLEKRQSTGPKIHKLPTIMETIYTSRKIARDYQPTPDEDSVEGRFLVFASGYVGRNGMILGPLPIESWGCPVDNSPLCIYSCRSPLNFPSQPCLIAGGYPKIELVESTCR